MSGGLRHSSIRLSGVTRDSFSSEWCRLTALCCVTPIAVESVALASLLRGDVWRCSFTAAMLRPETPVQLYKCLGQRNVSCVQSEACRTLCHR